MKVLLINGSPNAKGCTYTALCEVAKTLEENGISTEIIQAGNKEVRGCIGCNNCKQNGKCVFNDIVNEVAPKFEEADGIVFGSPVYYAGLAGGLKSFLDRLFYSTSFSKRLKVGAAVASARRAGTVTTFDDINRFFSISQMPSDVQKDEEGLQVMRVLGRNMAFLIKSIALGKEKYGFPEEEERIGTDFIR